MIERCLFGTLPDGQNVEQIRMTNECGMSVTLLTLGATIQRWQLNDAARTDIVLGFDKLEDYLADAAYVGRTVGRYANRIANGHFKLGKELIKVTTNLQGNSLHGGIEGFSHRVWQAETQDNKKAATVTMSLISEDGDQGFPGRLRAQVKFCLTKDNCLRVTYRATSDKDTVFNPTQHSYFNLAGHQSGKIDEHCLQINADFYTPCDEQGIPTGELREVAGSGFDFRQERMLGTQIATHQDCFSQTQGLDHNWCVKGYEKGQKLNFAAKVCHEKSGHTLQVYTDMPGIQVYTANFLSAETGGKEGALYGPLQAICLETQYYPDSPNQRAFPTATLRCGDSFESITEYRFSFAKKASE